MDLFLSNLKPSEDPFDTRLIAITAKQTRRNSGKTKIPKSLPKNVKPVGVDVDTAGRSQVKTTTLRDIVVSNTVMRWQRPITVRCHRCDPGPTRERKPPPIFTATDSHRSIIYRQGSPFRSARRCCREPEDTNQNRAEASPINRKEENA